MAGARGCPWGRNSEFEPVLALAICLACVIGHEQLWDAAGETAAAHSWASTPSKVAKPTWGAHRPGTIAHGQSDLGEY